MICAAISRLNRSSGPIWPLTVTDGAAPEHAAAKRSTRSCRSRRIRPSNSKYGTTYTRANWRSARQAARTVSSLAPDPMRLGVHTRLARVTRCKSAATAANTRWASGSRFPRAARTIAVSSRSSSRHPACRNRRCMISSSTGRLASASPSVTRMAGCCLRAAATRRGRSRFMCPPASRNRGTPTTRRAPSR